MEKITREKGVCYYGDVQCDTVDDAYRKYRNDYHKSLGKAVYRMLNRPARVERIHGSGMYLQKGYEDGLRNRYDRYGKVNCRFMGIVGISYVRMVGIWDCADVCDESFREYLDWLFSRGSNALRIVGRGGASGRTSKRIRTRYR